MGAMMFCYLHSMSVVHVGHLGAKIGYCDATVQGEGSLCAPSHHKGSWTVKTLAECVELCLGCPQ